MARGKSDKKSDKRSHRKRIVESDSDSEETIGSNDSDSEEEWSTEEEYEEESEEESEEGSEEGSEADSEADSDDSSYVPRKELSESKIKKIIADMFPSKYSKKRAQESKKSKKSKDDKKRKSKRLKKEKTYKDDTDTSTDSDAEYEEYMKGEGKDGNINIIFGFGEEEDETEELIDDDNEECDSDDEKTFMKESYEAVDLPEETKKNEEAKKQKIKATKKNKTSDSHESEETLNNKFESEYNDLVDMKKYLSKKLHDKPNSKTLLKSLNETKDAIKKLVKKARNYNTKHYHKMITSHKQKTTNEMEYFKKKLSNKEQMKIMKDLKEVNEKIHVNVPYRVQLLESQVPNKYKAAVMQKLNMLKTMEPSDNEYYKIKSWVDAFMRIPFGRYKDLEIKMDNGLDECSGFMSQAIEKLDTCVYGLNDAKMQILQMVGQWIANPGAMGTAIAVQGPPGTGKTSLIKDGISKILGREFAFLALGGASDSSFLEGHSYTYEGSVWGKIVQILMESKSMNPVIYFDELDKVSDTAKGEEIIGILTHLTDTTQNSAFHDKYFSDIDFDLSKCLFIFSYNDESKVNPILKDRMYRIQTKGYSSKEKVIIATKYLLPKIREQVNFKEDDVIIPNETIEYIISNTGMTKSEEGVRNLKRCLEIIHTKLNLFRLVKKDENNMISKEIKLEVTFPFTVKRSDVDILVKSEEGMSQSMLALYV